MMCRYRGTQKEAGCVPPGGQNSSAAEARRSAHSGSAAGSASAVPADNCQLYCAEVSQHEVAKCQPGCAPLGRENSQAARPRRLAPSRSTKGGSSTKGRCSTVPAGKHQPVVGTVLHPVAEREACCVHHQSGCTPLQVPHRLHYEPTQALRQALPQQVAAPQCLQASVSLLGGPCCILLQRQRRVACITSVAALHCRCFIGSIMSPLRLYDRLYHNRWQLRSACRQASACWGDRTASSCRDRGVLRASPVWLHSTAGAS